MHEVAHGYVALLLGDNTAKQQGRLTFNPLPHIDPFMTIILPILTGYLTGIPFGAAKPVPVNPYNFRHASPRRGMMLVGLAGPATNWALMGMGLAYYHVLVAIKGPVFSLPLIHLIMINLTLGCLNMLPVPPLDGSRVLAGLVPRSWAYKIQQFERHGLLIVMLLMLSGGLEPIFIGIRNLANWMIPINLV